ncbi:MAG: FtsH protease activity modulator HflK [Bdellovibrionaceae bacterium]|jgi:modulator of FtsH protease HflK|nr:FtsH protease activity modulator HflK [Pseudobdellovibrionaceae bacterium]
MKVVRENRQYDSDDIERFIKENKSKLFIVFVVLIGIWITGSVFYTVEPDEEAVVLRFGRYVNTTQPGLHFKLPFGIDDAVKVKTKRVFVEEFGFRTRSAEGRRTTYSKKSFDAESLMLTGDLNVADVEWTVHYQISEPQKYLFQTRSPIKNIRDISEAIMRRVAGDMLVNDVLTVGRVELALNVKVLMQEIFDRYNLGINVVTVKLQDVNPPEPVQPSFNEVNAAKQEQEQVINNAERKYNEIIPEARGKADKAISKAKAYATEVVNRAKGDTDRFKLVLKEYNKAPLVTRKRMYLDTMNIVLKKLENPLIVDNKLKGLLPIYGELKKGVKSE